MVGYMVIRYKILLNLLMSWEVVDRENKIGA